MLKKYKFNVNCIYYYLIKIIFAFPSPLPGCNIQGSVFFSIIEGRRWIVQKVTENHSFGSTAAGDREEGGDHLLAGENYCPHV